MKALTSDVDGREKKKSPIKEQKQAIETLKKEGIHHHTLELIQKKMSTNGRNCFIEVKNELKDFMDETDKAKYISIFLYNIFIFIIIIESNLVSKIDFISKTEEKRRKKKFIKEESRPKIKMRYDIIGSLENKIKTKKYCNLKKLDNNKNNNVYDIDKRNKISNKIIIRNEFRKILLIYYLFINLFNIVLSFQKKFYQNIHIYK